MKGRLIEILEPFQARVSKAGKPYSAMKARVVLDNGEEAQVFIFEDLPIDSELELVKKGEYWNVAPKPKGADNPEAMKILEAIYNMVKDIKDKLFEDKVIDPDEEGY